MRLGDKLLYIFIYLCDYLQVPAIYYISYDVQWFCFWDYGLSTERMVAHPLHFFLFLPSVKVLAIIRIAALVLFYVTLRTLEF